MWAGLLACLSLGPTTYCLQAVFVVKAATGSCHEIVPIEQESCSPRSLDSSVEIKRKKYVCIHMRGEVRSYQRSSERARAAAVRLSSATMSSTTHAACVSEMSLRCT